jgi:hypothetical protein
MTPRSGATRLGGRRTILAAALVALSVLYAVVAPASKGQQAPSAVAGLLPQYYRLLLTEQGARGVLHTANYGKPGTSPGDGPLTVYSIRGRGKPPYEYAPGLHPGDRRAVVRGHGVVVRTLTDEGRPYARELVWRERPDLVVAVSADFPSRRRRLRQAAEGVGIIDERAWARLHMQTSHAAIIGHVAPDMRRVRVKRGGFGGHRWTLYALIPAHFPLSRDDLRVSCFELRYRRKRGHGDNCGVVPDWQRVGGRIFTFGAVPRRVKRIRIRPWQDHAFDLRIRTVRARRGPRVRYFATPLPEGTCAVIVSPATHPHAEGSVAAPIRGSDWRRCAHASSSGGS